MFESMMRARETRAMSPAFKAEMAREKKEFMNILSHLGNSSLDTGYDFLLKIPLGTLANELKTFYDEKYGQKACVKDTFKMFFGKDGALHNATRVVSSALHLSGKAVKMGIRKLTAI